MQRYDLVFSLTTGVGTLVCCWLPWSAAGFPAQRSLPVQQIPEQNLERGKNIRHHHDRVVPCEASSNMLIGTFLRPCFINAWYTMGECLRITMTFDINLLRFRFESAVWTSSWYLRRKGAIIMLNKMSHRMICIYKQKFYFSR